MVLPPAAMGPVVALIGLELAGTAASNAGLKDEVLLPANIIVFLVTLLTAVIGSVVFRGFLSVIPILIAIIAGYVASLACGIVDFSEVAAAPLFALPNFQTPKFNMQAIAIVLPVLLVITSEHIGHQIVTSKIVGRDLLKDFRFHRFCSDNNLRGKHRCYGYDKSLQRLCYRRCSGTIHHLFLYRQDDNTYQYHTWAGYRRYLIPALRYDRCVWYPYPCRCTGRLRQIP